MVTTQRRRSTRSRMAPILMETLESRTHLSISPLAAGLATWQQKAAPKEAVVKAKASKVAAIPPIINPSIVAGIGRDRNLQIVAAPTKNSNVPAQVTLNVIASNDRYGNFVPKLIVSAPGFKGLTLSLNRFNGFSFTDKTIGGSTTVSVTDLELIDSYIWMSITAKSGKVTVDSVVEVNVTASSIYHLSSTGFTANHFFVGNYIESETGGVRMSTNNGFGTTFVNHGSLDTTFYGTDNTTIISEGGNNTVYAGSGSVIDLRGDGNDVITVYAYQGTVTVNSGDGWDTVYIYGYTNGIVTADLGNGGGEVLQYSALMQLNFYGDTDGSYSSLIKDESLMSTPDVFAGTISGMDSFWYQDLSNRKGEKG